MPVRDDTSYRAHRPSGSQPTLKEQTDEAESAFERAVSKAVKRATPEIVAQAGQNFHLQVQRALSLQQSQSMEWASKATRWWKAIAAIGIAASITMGTMMASCMNAYHAARVDAVEPAARAEQKATDANDLAKDHASRLDEIESTQKVLASAVERLNGAVVALTIKLADEPERIDVPAPPRPRKGSR